LKKEGRGEWLDGKKKAAKKKPATRKSVKRQQTG
jgi:hypothetical protein